MTTHDYRTQTVDFTELLPSDVLVGECGGLSACFTYPRRNEAVDNPLVWLIGTEHGTIMGSPGEPWEILHREGQ